VTVHRGAKANDMAGSLDARAFTHGGEIYLPSSHGPLDSGKGRSLLAHELTHVAQQRRFGSSLPAEHTRHGQSLEADAVAAERSGTLPLAVPPAASGDGAASAGAQRAPAAPSPERADETMTVHLATSSIQRAPATDGVQRAPMAQGGRGDRTDQELEDLAAKLYSRIGRRLRTELLVDRERAGLALDVR
jgi:hypothetical protein